ncbi:MAG: FAD binding domain-containing protein [Rhodomicrobium sp.]
MKPAPFDYYRPGDIAEASSALQEANGGAKLIAGGQSLGPMLNLRLVQPHLLVDITGVEELSDFDEDDENLRIGACITASDIEDQRIPTHAVPPLAKVAGGIAYRAIRNRGTIGGSLCHADPAADWVNLLPALGASYVLADARGTRTVPAEEFMTAAFETSLKPSEILRTVIIPKLSADARWGYAKISWKTGKFAMAIGIVISDPGRGIFRALIGATHGKPIILVDAVEILSHGPGKGVKVNETRFIEIMEKSGIAEGPAQRLHLVALRRAATEAFAS